MISPDTPIPCRHLMSKGRIIHGRSAHCLRETSGSSHYTCLRTQTVVGPDDRLCVPEACQPGRACYLADAPLPAAPGVS